MVSSAVLDTVLDVEDVTIEPVARPVSRTLPVAVRRSEIISAFSYALDLTEGQPLGHSARSCLIGMRIAQQIGMSVQDRADLYYAMLLKDAGCSSNASRLFHILSADEIRAKRDVKLTDWTKIGWDSLEYAFSHVATGEGFLKRMETLFTVASHHKTNSGDLIKIRCERGASIARQLGFSDKVSDAIHSLDEHWNGKGYSRGLRGEEIPLFSRIANLAQTLEVFFTTHGPDAAIEAVTKRSGRWFDPNLVKAAASLGKFGALWLGVDREDVFKSVVALEPEQSRVVLTEDMIDHICLAFAEVIDAKSPFTYKHSNGVADAALQMAEAFDMSSREKRHLRRAALLHDIGKLSVSNAILEKPGKLENDEWKAVKKHPYYTLEILRRVPGFETLKEDAAAHHERLDGSGYWRGWKGEQLSLSARILAVADVFDALHAKRPYRDSLPLEQVFSMLRKDAPHALDPDCVEALAAAKTGSRRAPVEAVA
jgi:putative nucleotidyltransferase with HDIG domain